MCCGIKDFLKFSIKFQQLFVGNVFWILLNANRIRFFGMNSKLFCFNAKKVKNILFFIQSGIVGLGIITFAIQLEIIQY